jgi:hypothetical protein
VQLGAACRWRRLTPGPGPVLAAQAWDLTVGVRFPPSVAGEGRVTLFLPLARRTASGLVPEPDLRLLLTVGARGRAFTVAVVTGADGRPSGGWEALCGVGGGLGLSLRADLGTGTVGCGLLWQRAQVRVRTSHLSHPDLGLTHRFEVALGKVGASPW